jgi:four helix bundle protein
VDSKQKTEIKSRSVFYDLLVWQKAMIFVKETYKITSRLPKHEQFALADQLRRSAISIPSNIAEGSKRGKKEFLQFLRIANASAAEAETQLLLVKDIYGIDTSSAFIPLIEVERMLESLMSKIRL